MLEPRFNAFDWYWDMQDGRAFSSRRMVIVPADDPGYVAFLDAGNPRVRCPKDEAGQDSLDELQAQILDHYGLHASLTHLAGGLRYAAVEALLVPVAVAGHTYRFQGDAASQAALGQATLLGERYEAANGAGSFRSVWKTADGFTAAPLALADLVTVGLAVGAAVQGCFAREAAADAGIAAGSLATREAVEAFFAAA